MKIKSSNKDLACTKVKLRHSSKDKQRLESSINRSSFASRVIGTWESRYNSLTRGCNWAERYSAVNIKHEALIESYKTKVNVLQNSIDKIVKENAILRLRCEFNT